MYLPAASDSSEPGAGCQLLLFNGEAPQPVPFGLFRPLAILYPGL